MRRIRYTLFCINWMWKHRTWDNTRQKWKRMEKDYCIWRLSKIANKARKKVARRYEDD